MLYWKGHAIGSHGPPCCSSILTNSEANKSTGLKIRGWKIRGRKSWANCSLVTEVTWSENLSNNFSPVVPLRVKKMIRLLLALKTNLLDRSFRHLERKLFWNYFVFYRFFNLSVWTMETNRLAIVFRMHKQVLKSCLKIRKNLRTVTNVFWVPFTRHLHWR